MLSVPHRQTLRVLAGEQSEEEDAGESLGSLTRNHVRALCKPPDVQPSCVSRNLVSLSHRLPARIIAMQSRMLQGPLSPDGPDNSQHVSRDL